MNLEERMQRLEEQVRHLQQQVLQRDQQIQDRDQQIQDRDQQIRNLERQIEELRALPPEQRQLEERNILTAIYQYVQNNPGKTALVAIIAAGIIGAFLIYMGVGLPVAANGIITWLNTESVAAGAAMVAVATQPII